MERIPKKTSFYWGFPVPTGTQGEKPGKERGVAMILAILVIAMMLIFTSDMIVNSTVSLQLAASQRDKIKAEYMAKSGINLAQLLISADWGIDLFKYQMSGNKTLPSDGRDDVWSVLNGLPIGGATMEMVTEFQEQFDLSKISDSKVLDELKLFDGEFTVNVEDESQRINVNSCAKGRADECLTMLRALMSCPAEKAFLDKKKRKPLEVAANIKDWVDEDTAVEQGSNNGSENDPYVRRETKVSPKNAPLDSLDELKTIEGWDDDMHRIFSRYLTLYPLQTNKDDKPRINLNTASREILGCLLPESNVSCAERSALYFPYGDKTPDVIDSNAGLEKVLTDVFCERDKEKAKLFTFRSDLYRVTVSGEVGGQTRRVEAVLNRRMPDQTDEKNGFKGTYKYLQWKML